MALRTTRLGALLRIHRTWAAQDLRTAAKEFGISAATLSRIERGGQCDVPTFLNLMKWLSGPAIVKGGQ